MEYPPIKPYEKALHELRKEDSYERYKESFPHILDLTGNDPIARLEVYYYFCNTYCLFGSTEDVESIIGQARNEHTPDIALHAAYILLMEARFNSIANNIDLSNRQTDEALTLLGKEAGPLVCRAKMIKSRNSFQLKKFDECLRLAFEVIEGAEAHPDMIAGTHTGLALAFRELLDFKSAEYHYQQALKFFEQNGYSRDAAGMYSNLANLMRERADTAAPEVKTDLLRRASEFLMKGLAIVRQLQEPKFTSMILVNLAYTYAEIGEIEEAIQYVTEGVTISRTLTIHKENIGQALAIAGYVFFTARRYDEALEWCEEAIQYFDYLQPHSQPLFYGVLCDTCQRLGLWEKGFHYAQKLVVLQKEYVEKQQAGAIYHNKVLEEKIGLEEELHKLHVRSMEEKMQMQAVQLVSQTDLLDKFRNDLRAIVREIDEPIAALKRIKEKLKELPCAQIDWTKFEAQFNEVHPDFRSKLHLKFPELTEMEQRIAVMVRMDLKSADIAKLFCITERAVEFHRLNVRKKLNLGSGESLPKFLQSI